ncbi:hypothetical protein Dsin_019205 [Dipteronia sinensis]|uniref:Reverse transcriptase zinc-binding domain-containing protein n=1 Tax=Dipteronia sinensis TaxID=43782 RepID=A0AAE0A7K8_9ROSI|nr:hypothetical protein Dsin_019205 [Dipteronia sinensis]
MSWSGGHDSLAWHFDKRGVHTVQSGYRLALSQKISAIVSNSSVSHNWRETLWRLNLPPKVKFFVWRACWNVIPCLENLWKRKDIDSPRCDRCAAPVESSTQAIFWCKEVQNIWINAGFPSLLAGVHLLPVLEVVSFASSVLGRDELGHLCMITWAIGENRNSIYNSGKGKRPELMVSGTVSLLSEFQDSKLVLSTRNSPAIRDDKGLVIAAHSNQLPGLFNVDVGELIALREGFLLGLFYNLHVDFSKFVSPTVVSFLNVLAPLVGESKFIVQDIKSMFLAVGICKSLASSKSRNSLALQLALLAFSSAWERLWQDYCSFASCSSL